MWPPNINIWDALLLFGVLFYKSERGGPGGKGDILGHEGHEYLVTVVLKDGRNWRCRQYRKFKCPATAKTRGREDTVDTSVSKDHNHEGNPAQVL